MKQQQYLTFLVLYLIVLFVFVNAEVESDITKRLENRYGFKCYGQTKFSIPIRVSLHGEVECFSLDGKDCVKGLNTEEDCVNFIQKNYNKLNAITCGKVMESKTGKTGYDTKGHWCQFGYDFFFKKWHCFEETGLKAPIRMNHKTFKIECLSKNGRDCIWGNAGIQACQKANNCSKFRKKMKKLSCGGHFKKIWGHNGYKFPLDHWCKKAFAYYTYRGEFLGKDKTGLNILIRIDNKGNIQCLTKDNKTCAEDQTEDNFIEIAKKETLNIDQQPKVITCGAPLRKLTKATGFEDKNHWCVKAYNVIYKRKKYKHPGHRRIGYNGHKKVHNKHKSYLPVGRDRHNEHKSKSRDLRGRNHLSNRRIKNPKKRKYAHSKYNHKPKKILKKVTPKLIKSLAKKPFIKKIHKMIKKGIDSPRTVQRLKKLLKKHNVGAGKHFLNALSKKIFKKQPFKNIVQKIAKQKYTNVKKKVNKKQLAKSWVEKIKNIIEGEDSRTDSGYNSVKEVLNSVVRGDDKFWKGLKVKMSKGDRFIKIFKYINDRIKANKSKRIKNMINNNIITDLRWPNMKKINNPHEFGIGEAFMGSLKLPPKFAINIKVKKLNDNKSIFIGLSTTSDPEIDHLLGKSKGQWSLCGINMLLEEGRWKFTDNNYIKQGDIITIWGNNGKIGYKVNGDKKNSYSYNLGSSDIWFGATFEKGGNELEILNIQGPELKKLVKKAFKNNGVGKNKNGAPHKWRVKFNHQRRNTLGNHKHKRSSKNPYKAINKSHKWKPGRTANGKHEKPRKASGKHKWAPKRRKSNRKHKWALKKRKGIRKHKWSLRKKKGNRNIYSS